MSENSISNFMKNIMQKTGNVAKNGAQETVQKADVSTKNDKQSIFEGVKKGTEQKDKVQVQMKEMEKSREILDIINQEIITSENEATLPTLETTPSEEPILLIPLEDPSETQKSIPNFLEKIENSFEKTFEKINTNLEQFADSISDIIEDVKDGKSLAEAIKDEIQEEQYKTPILNETVTITETVSITETTPTETVTTTETASTTETTAMIETEEPNSRELKTEEELYEKMTEKRAELKEMEEEFNEIRKNKSTEIQKKLEEERSSITKSYFN